MLKLQYLGHLMRRTDSLEKTLMLGKTWQEEKETTEDEMVEWHHRLDRHEFEQAPEVGNGQGGLVCCSPWGHEESDTTERLNFHFSLSCIGEGNGNPLQCSCLENPRDRGAWCAAVHGVTESLTQLSDSATTKCCCAAEINTTM